MSLGYGLKVGFGRDDCLHRNKKKCQIIAKFQIGLFAFDYGNTGCGVFKRRVQNLKKIHKNQHTQMKLLNLN
jgi:hypothetical protein